MKPPPPRLEALARDRFTGVTKAARDLGLAERTIRTAIATGELPTYVFGVQNRLRIVDVRAWLERHRR
jgi:excisionase family DNA binding protein